MSQRNVALGFYQSFTTAQDVLHKLKQRGYSRFAHIHHDRTGRLVVKRSNPFSFFVTILWTSSSLLIGILLLELSLSGNSFSPLILIPFALVFVIGLVAFWLRTRVDGDILSHFKKRVILNEILVVVQVGPQHISEVLSILRQVKSGHPVSFLLRSDMDEDEKLHFPKEPVMLEQLQERAIMLAISIEWAKIKEGRDHTLLKRLNQCENTLHYVREDVSKAEYIEQTISLSAEWLLDNMYIIEAGIEEVRRNLPKKYYQELPTIIKGPLACLPRIYGIAVEIVNSTAGKLTRENIITFLESYQTVHPLTIGELWALPLMLRLSLIEWIKSLAIRVDNRMREGELASFWGNQLLTAASREPHRLPDFLADLSSAQPCPSPHFIEELLDHLFNEEAVVPLVRKWIEEQFTTPIGDIIHEEQLHETTEQVIFSNSIVSLITLSQLSWQEVFEMVSPVDAILEQDPLGIYSKMDFSTRNQYRETLEFISRYSKISEVHIAKQAIQLANQGAQDVERHVGYYLIDEGRSKLEKWAEYQPKLAIRFQRWLKKYPHAVYLGGITFLTICLEIAVIYFSLNHSQHGYFLTAVLSIFAFFPLSELSLQFMNFWLPYFLRPTVLPKMWYEKEIPSECKTLVIVPMMLFGVEPVQEEIHRLEIRYLANPDPALRFGLFSDFSDAPEKQMEADAELLNTAVKGLEALNAKYKKEIFYLFHRQRVWSTSENAWIGWERKRGKLEVLNRFLMGDHLPENILYVGQKENLTGTRYVITLDADTQLPKNQAKKLIEVISHPLNHPQLSSDGKSILRGYTIIQPRVCTDFSQAKATWFSIIFSEPAASDPYTQAISSIYQDLFNEGTYHGKGIYDVKAFHQILSGRFPEAHLLSHDLLEGVYVRVAFASDVCLFDLHPEDYQTWTRRQHRWMRGDFQIADWIMPKVPYDHGKKEVNPLSFINRWKIFDNLRRAFLPLSTMLLWISAWILSPIAGLWTGLTVVVLFIPFMLTTTSRVFSYPIPTSTAPLTEIKIGFLRAMITLILLPYAALLSLDAFCRVVYRRIVSHHDQLQWTVSGFINWSPIERHRTFVWHLGWISAFALLLFVCVFFVDPISAWIALPFCVLWMLTPLVVYLIDQPLDKRIDQNIGDSDRRRLRLIARKTWRYFDDFVTPQTHWLPPDNYQSALRIEVAPRTSPTNIGMWLVSVLSAYDFKFITADQTLEKVFATIQQLKRLERYEGHFLNWFNIRTLDPLYPRYISTVDSGNLLASLWTLQQGLDEMIRSPVFPIGAFEGTQETHEILINETKPHDTIRDALEVLKALPSNNLHIRMTTIRHALRIVQNLFMDENIHVDNVYWLKQFEDQLQAWDALISRYLSWVEIVGSLSDEKLHLIHSDARKWCKEIMQWDPTLEQLAKGEYILELSLLIENAEQENLPQEIKEWTEQLKESLSTAQWFAGEQIGRVSELKAEIEQISSEMNMQFLYHPDRKLFAIGYNVDDKKLDTSYYDLLASEARIASLVAIAKESIPIEHWWSLGRSYSKVQGQRVLLSWGGTMFEYLMPLIFTKHFPDSLLGEACASAVKCQITYGKKRGIPWGISEAAYSAIDMHKIYQYRSFGVPGLGLKRGLEEDLVVSPYSTALALTIDPQAAIQNLKRLSDPESHHDLLGSYGYYESIDFTRQRSPRGERGVIVHAYMAHHQGMILTSINNLLNNSILNNRFHRDLRIAGVESLLYERIPTSPRIIKSGVKTENLPTRLKPFSMTPVMGIMDTPKTTTPKVNLLSNGHYSVMVTNAGGGYSRWHDMDITRWRSDTTCDAWGNFFYIQDTQSKDFWSVAYQPTWKEGKKYLVSFKPDKAEFRRKDSDIETITDVVVSSEDQAEVWLITLINQSSQTRVLELTSYMELALAPHAADRTHPCFNKFFIETEALPDHSGLLAFRRLRAPDEQPIFAAHVVATSQSSPNNVQYETDRSRFIGRGNSLQDPDALRGSLSNTTGTVLDPIFSLRKKVVLEPGHRVEIAFVTAVAESREGALNLMQKYQEIAASHRAIELAWTYAQLEMRHLRIHQEDVQLYQKLASRILYPHAQLRSSEDRLRSNRLGQSRLWAHGISGDLPMAVVSIGDIYDMDIVKQTLIAHAFWSLRGLKVDLVILNEEKLGYENPLFEQLQRLIQGFAHRSQTETTGGVFLLNSGQIPADELNLIFSMARAILIGARGPLRQQLVSPLPPATYPSRLIVNKNIKEEPSKPLPFVELSHFNGLGGFTADSREYVIYLDSRAQTPAPWINVIANPNFGFMVSEAGVGCAWYGNSQSNRIIPWSNDPVLDPISDAIYLRDEQTGTFWTPTPSPIRELDPYRIRHGQGYTRFEHNSHGIEQDLLMFVPVNDEGGLPLRIQRLRLLNRSARHRRLSATAYSEWVLGTDKETTQMHVNTDWDPESQALFAYNRYNMDFGDYLGFACSLSDPDSFTGDRTEFIGRIRSVHSPAALKRKALSGRTGAGLDPCSALQVMIDLEPGAEKEVIFILGYAPDAPTARSLIVQCRTPGMVEKLFYEMQSWWNKTLETVQVDIPNLPAKYFMNRWLLYQVLSCRYWGRSAFYQSGGAFGFRDQLQDVLALLYAMPKLAREHILRSAARQFVEGDVQHWWHPQTGAGVRTRITDDLLWLPFATAQYVRVTGDVSILDEKIPFLEASPLTEEQHEVYSIPTISQESDTLLEHCRRALRKGLTAGPHGLPLMGCGDWNDGMNRVGIQGKGESIWLAWFLIHVMHDFADLLVFNGQPEAGEGFKMQAKRLAEIVEDSGWDGEWYRRAYFDDGTPLGSKECAEATIDSIAQSWAVICGLGNQERVSVALNSAEKYLVQAQENRVLLLTPPFDKTTHDPGYIKGYPPGIRENGGQYTHGSLWLAKAFALRGDGNKAVALLHMMHPDTHSSNKELIQRYKVEPYVLVGDIYAKHEHEGRGGWTWYSGSASVMYRIWLEEVLGFKRRGNKLTLNPCIPTDWKEFSIRYQYLSALYVITVKNSPASNHQTYVIKLDGAILSSREITLLDDGKEHHLEINL